MPKYIGTREIKSCQECSGDTTMSSVTTNFPGKKVKENVKAVLCCLCQFKLVDGKSPEQINYEKEQGWI